MQTQNPTQQLTPRQLQVLKVIWRFEASQCFSATIAELSGELNVSRSTVFEHIEALRRKKLLTRSRGRARSSRLTAQARRLLDAVDQQDQDSCSCDAGAVPLAGRVAAGVPIEAIEDNQTVSLRSIFGDGTDIFALEVAGDSMIDEGINDGDVVICQKSSTARNGQLVVAIVDDNSATLKKFYKEDSRVRLQPANENYQPIYSDNCRIEAIVLGSMRRF